MKRMAVLLCCVGVMSAWAGLKVPGPIQVVDAGGKCRYDYAEVHDIIGEVDAVEIIGRRDGISESRGYVCSASPAWVLPLTNGVQRSYRILADGQYELKSRHGISVSLIKCSPDEDGRLAVVADGDQSLQPGPLNGLHADDAYARIMMDSSSELQYRSSGSSKFDDGSGDSVLVSFYSNNTGLVKVWYELVDSANVVLAKGWVSGRIDGGCLVDRTVVSLYGEKPEVDIYPREVNSTLKSFDCKDIAWLHVNIKRGNASASFGEMIKRD